MNGAEPGRFERPLRYAADVVLGFLNRTLRHLLGRTEPVRLTHGADNEHLRALIERESRETSDISDHLLRLYSEAAALQPSLMVELGTRAGESTRALTWAARRSGGTLISVDREEIPPVVDYGRWYPVRSDDAQFAQAFPSWCDDRGLRPEVEFLFVDTSHEYDHTRRELDSWLPYLAKRCKLAFHDTHLTTLYRRRDGTLGRAWDNDRGVIRCLEELLDLRLDERMDFTILRKGWLVRHYPLCNGLTVLERVTEE